MADEKTTNILDELSRIDTAEHETDSGITADHRALIVKKASDFRALTADEFKRFKDDSTIAAHLPKAPTPGAHDFLLPKSSADIRLQFEDAWTASSATYAAAAELFISIKHILQAQDIDIKEDTRETLQKQARRLLLLASNAPARHLSIFKYILKKTAVKSAQKPGSTREQALDEQEIKELSSTLDTISKLKRHLPGRGRRPQGRRPGRGNGFTSSFQRQRHRPRGGRPFYPSYPSYPRGRGQPSRGRGGRGAPANQ